MHGQDLVNWVFLAGFYASVAVGFSLVWGIMNIVNLAHGALMLVGAYVALVLYQHFHLDPFASIPIAMAVLFTIGWVVQYVAINRVIRAPFLVTFMLTFGLDLLIIDIIQQHFGGDVQAITTSYAGKGIAIGSTLIPYDRMATTAIAIGLTAALSLFLSRTHTGNAILATGMDRDAARLMGISIARIYALTFAIGAALAGAAGAMLAEFQPFTPVLGGSFTLRAFVIVVLGGLGTPWAALAGALVFGLAETVVPLVPNLGAGYEDAVAFAVLVLVLMVRPTGLFGKQFYS
ncbi:MAG: branched-chain amino acid ABC transporter permease [Chloroflexota bacterium]